ncbi:MAG TPA: hypothetical protein PLD47_02795 [Aggregatilineales bacterium]|nr:hypothetical protein [Anaerolineales bacterium]HRE46628.1 hypothetical protein [Aggregatilineales bacterium]
MAVMQASYPAGQSEAAIKPEGLWLRNRNWDTIFMTMSVFLVPTPYILYLLLNSAIITANVPGWTPDHISNVARNLVNLVVAVLVGGPHMYATFMRTALDKQFVSRYPMLIRSSIIIPIVVVSLAFLNLNLLLTIFFFWASIHVLHQVVYVVELYNKRADKKSANSLYSKLIDYALVLTCLFPIAALKISQGNFQIGTNDLTTAIPIFFQQTWIFYTATGIFVVALGLYLQKTYREWRGGYLHLPKTIFIMITVPIACTMPAFDNLDTAFQGLNTWHSFQYLALTFYIIKLRQQAGDLVASNPMVNNIAAKPSSWRLYLFSLSMLGGSIILGIVVYIVVGIFDPTRSMDKRFDTAYYTAILCFLWIHYYHDHFLFTDFEAIEREAVK